MSKYNSNKEIVERYENIMLKKKNVIGLGEGYKITDGKTTPEKAIMILVEKKEPKSQISKKNLVPDLVEDIQTDVYETGPIDIQPLGFLKRLFNKVETEDTLTELTRKSRWRPIPGGVSFGNALISSGTYSWKAKNLSDGSIVSYTNAHVGASDLLKDMTYQRSRKLLQPGAYFGGNIKNDLVGENIRFVKLNKGGNNWVDGCVGSILNQEDFADEILEIGVPSKVGTSIEAGLEIKKSGATTGLTRGNVVSINSIINVGYGDLGIIRFVEQIVGTRMSAGGDSGSSMLADGDQNTYRDNELLGVLFAGGPNATIFNPIWNFIKPLNIQPLIKRDFPDTGDDTPSDITIEFRLDKIKKIANVNVKDRLTAEPISGALVNLTSSDYKYAGRTNLEGQLTFAGIHPGKYTGSCSKVGYTSHVKEITI